MPRVCSSLLLDAIEEVGPEPIIHEGTPAEGGLLGGMPFSRLASLLGSGVNRAQRCGTEPVSEDGETDRDVDGLQQHRHFGEVRFNAPLSDCPSTSWPEPRMGIGGTIRAIVLS